ncbi:MAG: serpin family protein [bacterium]|nr:serpin family protein [bacterium]
MSKTQTLIPVVSALVAAETFLGRSRAWRAGNSLQTHFLGRVFEPMRAQVPKLPELSSCASHSADDINRFLAERKFAFRLVDPFPFPGDFGTASVLDVLAQWHEAGTPHPVWHRGKQYDGVRIAGDGVVVFHSTYFPNPIASLRTRTDDVVCLTATEVDAVGNLIIGTGVTPYLNTSVMTSAGMFGGVVFPMVSLDCREDIGWLLGMYTHDDDGLLAIVRQALQQTRFRMNEHGARAESAAAMGMTRSMSMQKDDLVIDQPFLCWIQRPGLPVPLFLAHITPQDWKNPGALA